MCKLKELDKNKKIKIAVFVLFTISFFVLAALLPYTHDDWYWNTVGLNGYLKGVFTANDNLNGRYIGNILAIILTKNVLLNVICKSISAFGAVFLCFKYSKSNILTTILLSIILLITIPPSIFSQVFQWTAGFGNYVPSILLTGIYFCIIQNIFQEQKPKYSKITPVVCFLLGIAGALFMENVTIHNVVIGLLIVFYAVIRYKKVYAAHIIYAIGAIFGAAIMFTNNAYGLISNGNDNYRTVPKSLKDLLSVVCANGFKAYNYIFVQTTVINILISLVLVLLLINHIKSNSNKKSLLKVLTIINVICCAISVVYNVFNLQTLTEDKSNFKKVFVICSLMCIFTFAFYLTAFVIPLFVIKNKDEKIKSILPIISIVVLVAPLLVVRPIAARCFFSSFFMLMMYAINLWGYYFNHSEIKNNTVNKINVVLSVVTVGVIIGLIVIYSTIFRCNNERLDFVKEQVKDGKQIVTICELPYKSYTYRANPYDYGTICLNLYYGFDESTQYDIIPYKDFKNYVAQYEATKN